MISNGKCKDVRKDLLQQSPHIPSYVLSIWIDMKKVTAMYKIGLKCGLESRL
jgi:hypothetical protein